jgi:putative transposase
MVSPAVQISDTQKKILLKISRQRTGSGRDIERSIMILAMASGYSNLRIENELGYSREKAKRCRDRWLQYQGVLDELEKEKGRKELEAKIRECISDAPRCGGPSKFTASDFCQILAVALEPPSQSGRPISHWSLNELKDEVEKRQIVTSISRSHLGDFLKRERRETSQDCGVAKP